ncbi:hypothetical protein IscW_ISCW003567 [Ixodes scapularis]|uniref:Uncharacterized protein n=1 Tax=Ixodes scapularis TaxID=6945 RepID=B7PI61_IXOSC|nr:hypothetical protein IscW_ISCW003567 [Ixodes scapularis]|eukprot:XP_002404458.1 hypothetical protein IscW_ISCW003567 [Ixodes scapularis]
MFLKVFIEGLTSGFLEASPSFEPYPDQQPRAEAASGRSDHRPKRRTKSKQRPRHETSIGLVWSSPGLY